jgi:hypothetical protein
MDQVEIEHLRQQFDAKVRGRFPDAPIERVEILHYGDDPEIEPGQLLARIVLEAPPTPAEGEDEDEGEGEENPERRARGRRLEDFHDANRGGVRELRRHLDKLPAPAILEIVVAGADEHGGPRMRLVGPRGGLGPGPEGGPYTPVMARVGPEDLETLDTLITAGIASSRAEAVRWALARIRERPAYERLRVHTREIEELKAQF